MNVKTLDKVTDKNTAGEMFKLVLFNSSHIWDDVIFQLQKATGYDLVHCEQIATIAHTKGKAIVKSGNSVDLETINTVLKEIKLVTCIE